MALSPRPLVLVSEHGEGAASPGRWQVWQCFCRIGATSLVNVGGALVGSCERDCTARQNIAAERMAKRAIERPTIPISVHPPSCDVPVDGKIAEALIPHPGCGHFTSRESISVRFPIPEPYADHEPRDSCLRRPLDAGEPDHRPCT